MGTIIDRMEMVVLSNSSMWYHIPNNGMVTKSNRNDNVTLEVMKRLITFGCSHTNHSYPTWANILGLNFDKHINFGRGGSGQLYTLNQLIGVQRHLNITKDDYIVVMMPGEGRWDIHLDESGHTHWKTFVPGHTGNYKEWKGGVPDWISKVNINFYALQGIVYINACLNILKEIGCDYKIALALETKEWFPKAYFDLEKELGNNTTLQEIGVRIKNYYKYIDEHGNLEEDGHWNILAHLEWVKETFPNLYDDKYDSTVLEWHSEMISKPKTHYDFEWLNTYWGEYDYNKDVINISNKDGRKRNNGGTSTERLS